MSWKVNLKSNMFLGFWDKLVFHLALGDLLNDTILLFLGISMDSKPADFYLLAFLYLFSAFSSSLGPAFSFFSLSNSIHLLL